MHRMLRTTILITLGMFTIGIISGCGDDSPEVVTDPSNPTTSGVTPPRIDEGPPHQILGYVDPAPGVEIPPNTQFSLNFDDPGIVAVTVNGVAATGSGLNWTVSLTLQEGDGQSLNVGWTYRDGRSGSQAVGPYTVRVPDTTPPRITSGTVTDGTVNVDPAPLNAGGFRFIVNSKNKETLAPPCLVGAVFNCADLECLINSKIYYSFHEAVAGSIKLTDEAGADLNWIATVAGQTATLTAVAGQELVNETTYKIQIDVHDGAVNRLETTITFVTKPK